MRFEANVRFWVQTESLEQAEEVLRAAAAAAYETLGVLAITDPEDGGMYGGSIEGVDEEAVAALTKDDLGPGRDWTTFQMPQGRG